MKAVYEGPIVVLPRQTTADVFVGKGWDNHSLYTLENGQPKLLKGKGLDPSQKGQMAFLRHCLKGGE